MIPAFLGLSGVALTAAERDFFRSVAPAGFILFGRNCESRAQLRALTDDLRALTGRDDLPVLIDQEGGRVQRMAPPEWPGLPAAERFAALYEKAPVTAMEAARLNARAIAAMLCEVGITVNCLPLLDVRRAEGDAIVGDRALGAEPMQVASLGRLVLDGLHAGGIVGVLKHLPGHGRATLDSHKALPVVDADAEALEDDIRPFAALAGRARMAMTAHIVFTAWDATRPATLSPIVVTQVIRGRIGFDGLLMSDDLGMSALAGGFGERAAATIAAGVDIALHCSGAMAEMEAAAGALTSIGPAARARLDRAMAVLPVDEDGHFASLARRRDALLALA